MTTGHSCTAVQQAELTAAARQALTAWGWQDAALRLIKHRENAVFEVCGQARRCALRLHRARYHSDAALHSELEWMRALAEEGVDVPQVVPNRDGKLFISREFAGLDGPVQVDLFEWIAGKPLGSFETGLQADGETIPHLYYTIGRLAGRLHNQSATWKPPVGFTRHQWDEHGLAGERPFWGRFWELQALSGEERRLMERARDRLRAELGALEKSPQTYSMIHADMVLENLMVEGEDVHLIDFDDAGFGWHLFELATSLYAIRGEEHFEAAQAALIQGYRSERVLADEQLERLALFVLARATTYLGWLHTRPESETARETTPMLIESACAVAETYLGQPESRS